jgi:KipI family sensor histidine kinase inhibitor
MRARWVGERALLIECADGDVVRAVDAEARRRRADGLLRCVDVVPGATTLLLDGVEDPVTVLDGLDEWPDVPPDADAQETVELPVTYDGPDLDAVAEHTGLSVEEVVERHRDAEFVVAFCGFAPGFAYLTGLPEELHVPRRDEPRSKVPAGSVGLAGTFTGVYPRSSPGGWQLIARTDADLWDAVRDPPALLAPGSPVRFVDA